MSGQLVEESKQFKWGAKKLNRMDAWKRWAPWILSGLLVSGLLYWRFLM